VLDFCKFGCCLLDVSFILPDDEEMVNIEATDIDALFQHFWNGWG
jgi:hypothetical protein